VVGAAGGLGGFFPPLVMGVVKSATGSPGSASSPPRVAPAPAAPAAPAAPLQVKLALVAGVVALIAWHLRRPGAHAIEGVIFLVSLAIVWLGLALAHGPAPV